MSVLPGMKFRSVSAPHAAHRITEAVAVRVGNVRNAALIGEIQAAQSSKWEAQVWPVAEIPVKGSGPDYCHMAGLWCKAEAEDEDESQDGNNETDSDNGAAGTTAMDEDEASNE